MGRILSIRYADTPDAEQLGKLYDERLDSCNASSALVNEIIRKSNETLAGAITDSITLVAEWVGSEGDIVGTGRLINVVEGATQPLMYHDTGDGGLELFTREASDVEFGSMVTREDSLKMGVGKAISALRALLATRFSGLFGSDHVLAEFLPHYDDDEKKVNAFGLMIIDQLMTKGALESVKKECSEILGRRIESNTDLLLALTRDLSTEQRNTVVAKYFPETIQSDLIESKTRRIMAHVGEKTVGALVNLERIYGTGRFNRTGYFPIDGGGNYTALISDGAANVRDVPTVCVDGDQLFQSQVMVLKPFNGTTEGLRGIRAWVIPGNLSLRNVQIPRQAALVIGARNGDFLTAYQLPASSKR